MFTELSLGCWSSVHSNLSMYRLPHAQCFSLSVTCTIHAPYCSRLFVVVFQEINCLDTFKHAYVCQVTELHLSTKFHVCQCCG